MQRIMPELCRWKRKDLVQGLPKQQKDQCLSGVGSSKAGIDKVMVGVGSGIKCPGWWPLGEDYLLRFTKLCMLQLCAAVCQFLKKATSPSKNKQTNKTKDSLNKVAVSLFWKPILDGDSRQITICVSKSEPLNPRASQRKARVHFRDSTLNSDFRAIPGSGGHSFCSLSVGSTPLSSMSCHSPAGERWNGFGWQILSVSTVALLIHTPMVCKGPFPSNLYGCLLVCILDNSHSD